MAGWMNLGQQFKMNAVKFPRAIAIKEKERCFTYFETNNRVNCLANSLIDLGLRKEDKIAVLMENSVEFVELYLAVAKLGLIIVPINFRLLPEDVSYIADNADVKVVFTDFEFVHLVDSAKSMMPKVFNYVITGGSASGYINYELLLSEGSNREPDIDVHSSEIWIIIYTSGTTGKPKGVMRSHESHVAFYLINAIDFAFNKNDICMNVMPLCHINSVFFSFIFLYIGASIYIHPAKFFNPDDVLEIIENEKITFISLIPTHYNLILNAAEFSKSRDLSSIRKLLCSSAPVKKSTKLAIMDFFPGVELYEGYGSSEAGIVTILKPEDQIRKLGSIGKESLGTDIVKILDSCGEEVAVGEIGEIYSRGPMLFDGYYKLQKKTKDSFKNGWFSAADMGCVDKDGFYKIVDRKNNMIITGGEHVYPSEVEEVIGRRSDVSEVAVVGIPDRKWGEKVIAVVVVDVFVSEEVILRWCKDQLASYKCPKRVVFVKYDDLPRTVTGKVLHRILRERFENNFDES